MIRVDMLGDEQTRKAFLRIAKALGNDNELIKKVIKPAAKPLVKAMRELAPELQSAPVFKVYRTPKKSRKLKAPKGMGKVVYTIKSGTLKKSIGIFTTPNSRKMPAIYVGPRYKFASWKAPEKGGWFWPFVQFGTDLVKANTFILKAAMATRSNVLGIAKSLAKKRVVEVVNKNGRKGITLQ
tara:strand:+ start:6471 stop:7016 length:546 start_codon:yes stop_codon:yes gene_type:complete